MSEAYIKRLIELAEELQEVLKTGHLYNLREKVNQLIGYILVLKEMKL